MNVFTTVLRNLKLKPQAEHVVLPFGDKTEEPVLSLSEVEAKINAHWYSSPSEAINDVTVMLDYASRFYQQNKVIAGHISKLQDMFLHMLSANNLSFFLEE